METGILWSPSSIVFINLVLAVVNAVVIGMAARTLLPAQRRAVIVSGAVHAIVLRVQHCRPGAVPVPSAPAPAVSARYPRHPSM